MCDVMRGKMCWSVEATAEFKKMAKEIEKLEKDNERLRHQLLGFGEDD
jgi:hypothetical protein